MGTGPCSGERSKLVFIRELVFAEEGRALRFTDPLRYPSPHGDDPAGTLHAHLYRLFRGNRLPVDEEHPVHVDPDRSIVKEQAFR